MGKGQGVGAFATRDVAWGKIHAHVEHFPLVALEDAYACPGDGRSEGCALIAPHG